MRLDRWCGGLFAGTAALAAAREFIVAFDRTPRTDAALLAATPPAIAWALFGIAAWLIAAGWPRRVGRSLHCARCGFEFERETRKLIEFCPECQFCWRWFDGVKRGRLVKSEPSLIAGAILLAALMAALYFREQAWNAAIKRMSTPNLTRLVMAAPWDQLDTAWDELQRRNVKAGTELALATAMLDKRAMDGYLPSSVDEWVRGVAADNGAQKLADLYYGDLIRTRTTSTQIVEAGSSLHIATTAEYRAGSANWDALPTVIAVEGVYIDGQLLEGSRQTQTRPPSLNADRDSTIAQAWARCEKPGAVRVELVYWVATGIDSYASVNWTDNGPAFVHQPVWLKKFVIERTVEVRGKPTSTAEPAGAKLTPMP